ncbi:single-stranded DNA-binding protein [Pedobacter polaris]|uniref:Single-stranded DNA-binding protein n=1 Tax=Pedobacter polaris TaxID=2571273 RepID=A0A4U1CGE7_9SPHI|nr:single-stranded DNA-binding protein [Pedobacter polaris]TKC05551.1 single-stranded DNA-binding protein [Pedobacter polaris]
MENVVNKVVLSGCAGSDAEVKAVSGNQKLARVNMAVNESYRNGAGEEVKKTQWVSLTFWGAKADIAELKIKKGTRFTIEGRLQNNNYEAKDGTKRYTTEIVVDQVTFKEVEAEA